MLALHALLGPLLTAGEYASVTNTRGTFHLYRAHPDEQSLHWQGADRQPLRTFEALTAQLQASGREPVFLMNAGIFEPGGVPSGLHTEERRELKGINMADGVGNFYLKPNGVFFIDDQGARILRSEVYAASAFKPRLALQSGPMLLINGTPPPCLPPREREPPAPERRRDPAGWTRPVHHHRPPLWHPREPVPVRHPLP